MAGMKSCGPAAVTVPQARQALPCDSVTPVDLTGDQVDAGAARHVLVLFGVREVKAGLHHEFGLRRRADCRAGVSVLGEHSRGDGGDGDESVERFHYVFGIEGLSCGGRPRTCG